jgi:hypothetical protein
MHLAGSQLLGNCNGIVTGDLDDFIQQTCRKELTKSIQLDHSTVNIEDNPRTSQDSTEGE